MTKPLFFWGNLCWSYLVVLGPITKQTCLRDVYHVANERDASVSSRIDPLNDFWFYLILGHLRSCHYKDCCGLELE